LNEHSGPLRFSHHAPKPGRDFNRPSGRFLSLLLSSTADENFCSDGTHQSFELFVVRTGTFTMLPSNNLNNDVAVPEPQTAFLFGLALGAMVPLFLLAVTA
jgi:hypothetical protein